MPISVARESWTRADLTTLPDDGNRYEVVRGKLFETPAPSPGHEAVVQELAARLREFVKRHGLGQVATAPSAMVFEGSEVQPDLVVRPRIFPPPVSWEMMPRPFLVAEVLSDSTRQRDLGAKRALYHAAGVAEYWVVDPDRRSISVFSPSFEECHTVALEWRPVEGVPAFILDVASLFEDSLGPARG